MSELSEHCQVCDHNVVDGIACDGPADNCPWQERRKTGEVRAHHIDLTAMAMPNETDAIRGIE
jgi:hypothetical protein